MASVKIKTNAPRQIHLMLVAERKRVLSGAVSLIDQYSFLIQREAIRAMTQDKKTGRLYPYKGGLHRASAAGESPAKRSGNLIRSLSVLKSEGGLFAHIGASAKLLAT